MKAEEVSEFERLQAQLQSVYTEAGNLSKKKPDDALNEFKLGLINKILDKVNLILGVENRPFDDFEKFDPDVVPTTSDVVLILSQYLNCFEKLRADNVEYNFGKWYWLIEGERSSIQTAPPRKLKF